MEQKVIKKSKKKNGNNENVNSSCKIRKCFIVQSSKT